MEKWFNPDYISSGEEHAELPRKERDWLWLCETRISHVRKGRRKIQRNIEERYSLSNYFVKRGANQEHYRKWRRMKNAMQAAKLPLPEFSTDGIFTVTLKRATVEETVGETVEETVLDTVELILKSMKTNPKVTTRELEAITGLSRRGIEYHLDKLKKNKLIERIGPTKGGTWKIRKK
jgi:hypothetical protein